MSVIDYWLQGSQQSRKGLGACPPPPRKKGYFGAQTLHLVASEANIKYGNKEASRGLYSTKYEKIHMTYHSLNGFASISLRGWCCTNSLTTSSASILMSLWYCNMASPLSRSSVMVLRRAVLTSLNMLMDLSHSQLVLDLLVHLSMKVIHL